MLRSARALRLHVHRIRARVGLSNPVARYLALLESISQRPADLEGLFPQYEGFILNELGTRMLGIAAESTKFCKVFLSYIRSQSHRIKAPGYRKRHSRIVMGLRGQGLGEGMEMEAKAQAQGQDCESKGKGREEGSTTPKPIHRCREREETPTTPTPFRTATGFSPSQKDDKEVKLLVSTLCNNTCTQFARRACYSGPSSRWALFDERDSEEISLVTNVSSKVARKAFSYLSGKSLWTMKEQPLCVMYIEPRNGGRVLVKGC